jgi:hypothetical protein
MFWAIVREWGDGGQSRLVFAGHCDTWEDVARIQLAHDVAPHRVVVDSGFNGQEVYAQCMAHSKAVPRTGASTLIVGWLPSKAREGRLVWVGNDGRKPSPYYLGKAALPPHLRVELPLAEFDVDALRDILARLRKASGDVPRWEIVPMPAGVDVTGSRRVSEDEYFLHLDSWRRRSRADPRRGKIVVEWASRTQKAADHLLDCELLQILAAMIHRKLRLSVEPDKAGVSPPQVPTSEAGAVSARVDTEPSAH